MTMAKRNSTVKVEESLPVEETTSAEITPETEVKEEIAPVLSPEPAPAKVEVTGVEKDPVKIELNTSDSQNNLPPAISKEEIAASVQEKLSRRTDEQGVDPFVPSTQLENEVKEVASKKGFPLSRGTEVGARLMARSKRVI
jgi:hypothetical protein